MAENIYETEGDRLLKSGDIEEALSEYTKAIKQEPNNAKLYLKMAAAEDILGMAEEFFEDYTKVTQLAPDTAAFYYAKSHLTYSFGAIPNTSDFYDIKSHLTYYLGEDYAISDKDKQEALSYADKAIELDPNYAEAYDWRAFLKKELNDYTGALADHDKAIELVYDYYYFYFFRSETRNKLKDFGGAAQDYSKTIELNPNFSYAYKQRGNMLKKIGNKEWAKEDRKIGKIVEKRIRDTKKDNYTTTKDTIIIYSILFLIVGPTIMLIPIAISSLKSFFLLHFIPDEVIFYPFIFLGIIYILNAIFLVIWALVRIIMHFLKPKSNLRINK